MKQFLFIFFITLGLFTFAQSDATANQIMEDAYATAKAENKNVFVKFGASWCGWCKRMDKQMKLKKTKDLFERNFVIVDLTIEDKKNLNTSGADILAKKWGTENQGLPFFVILDSDGKMIQNSLNEKGNNLGCPATKEEVLAFQKILKETSDLNDSELKTIQKTFEKK